MYFVVYCEVLFDVFFFRYDVYVIIDGSVCDFRGLW